MSTSTQQPAQPAKKPNPVIGVFIKVGEDIVHTIEWPITHAEMLNQLLASVEKDVPQTKTVIQGLVARIEAMGPDAIGALADKGLNIGDDVKVGTDIEELFTYCQQSVLPTIALDYTDMKRITGSGAPAAAPAPLPPAEPGEVITGPGLHNVVAP